MRLNFQNEWIVAWRDGAPIATSPDLICVLDSVNGHGVGAGSADDIERTRDDDEAVRRGGHIALIGVLTGRAGPVPTAHLMARQQRLQGLIVGSRQDQIDMVRALNARVVAMPEFDASLIPVGDGVLVAVRR